MRQSVVNLNKAFHFSSFIENVLPSWFLTHPVYVLSRFVKPGVRSHSHLYMPEASDHQIPFEARSAFIKKNFSSPLAESLTLSWLPKVNKGFFMRAESFFNFATYLDELAKSDPSVLLNYGDKSLHEQSHGESFLALFKNHFEKGLYILDEPEAALSPMRQLSFLAILKRLEKEGQSQFLIATHSPILLSYPGATVFEFSEKGEIQKVNYRDTDHYVLTKEFLENPERYFQHLFS